MSASIDLLDGLRVVVDDVIYMPSLDAPAQKPFPFIYFISIHNDSDVRVTLRGRKWLVQEENGEMTVVEGDGVVGQYPVIEPGGHFSYNSYHTVACNAVAYGAFFGATDDGKRVYTKIPQFVLKLPRE
ncbi:MAG: ApaG domain [Verrucomicrobia bacterium]|nr:MAG: ApaG domain [Verrucomicrobiota bacterium]